MVPAALKLNASVCLASKGIGGRFTGRRATQNTVLNDNNGEMGVKKRKADKDSKQPREVHVPKTLNINETFRFEKDPPPQHKVLVPKNLL